MSRNSLEQRESRVSRENRLGNHIASLVVNGVILWIMNALPSWNIPYLLASYKSALPAINLSLYVQMAMNVVLIFYRPHYFYHLSKVVRAGFSIYAISTILRVFPLDFSTIPFPAGVPSLNFITRVVLFIALGASAIDGIVNAVRFLGRVFRGEIED